ncbi:MAG TPA: hypothetical protein VMA13_05400 [Candidatus Saccharimonadales bacterium]|nr:hypothetical protein [Candidatus Saccharimonadales bacterium]
MKRNNADQNEKNAESGALFKSTCAALGQKILARIAQVKEAIFDESYETLQAHERLLRLALNEAEAAARETLYPHLVFPDLATEKIQAVVAWNAKAKLLRRSRNGLRPLV